MSVLDTTATEAQILDDERKVERRRKIEAAAIPLGTLALLLLAWQLGVRIFEVPTYIAPAPSDVAATFVTKFPILMENFWPPFTRVFLGFSRVTWPPF